MKTAQKLTVLVLVISLFTLLSCPAGTGPATMPVNKEKVTITFFSGDVVKKTDSGNKPIEIGEKLTAGDYIKTGENAICELMVGNKASIRIDENTEFAIKSVLHKEKTDVQLELVQGSLMTKIKKFTDAENEEFTVFSKSVACSVRGTAFKMTSLPGQKFDLQVAEGTVAVKPVSYTLESILRNNAAGQFSKTASTELGNGEILVPEGKALELNQDQVIALETQVALLSQDLISKKSATSKSEEITASLGVIKGIELVQRDLSEKDSKTLKPLLTLGGDFFEKDLEKIELKRVGLSTVPNNAYIFRDDVLIGQGAFSAIFEKGTKLKFLIKASGYKQQEIEVTAGTNSENVSVKLEDQPVVKIPFELRVAPSDADVSINDEEAVKAPLKTELNDGEEYVITISKAGYKTSVLTFVMGQAESNKLVALIPEILRMDKISNQNELIRLMPTTSEGLFVADGYGSVRMMLPNGQVKWTYNSSNNPNEMHYPVVSGNFVYFSGAQEWVQINVATGIENLRTPLTGEDKHLIGQHINYVPEANTVIVPGRTYANLYTAAGAFQKKITYGFKSSATPGMWGKNLVLTDSDGAFWIVGDMNKKITTGQSNALGTSIAVYGNTAFYGSSDGVVLAIDLGGSVKKWSVPISSGTPVLSDPLVIPDMGCIVFYVQNTLTGLRMTDGAKLFVIPGAVTPPSYRNGKLYFGASGSVLKMVPLAGGIAAVTAPLGKIPSTAPSFLGQKVYVGTKDGYILQMSDF